MRRSRPMSIGVMLVLGLGGAVGVEACTSLLVSRRASEDGSVMITYTCDGEFHPHLEHLPAADYEPGRPQDSFDKQIVRDYLETLDWDKRPPPPDLPQEVIDRAAARYQEIANRLMR